MKINDSYYPGAASAASAASAATVPAPSATTSYTGNATLDQGQLTITMTVYDPKVVTAVQRTIDTGGSTADATGATMGLLQIGAGAVNAASSDQATAQLQTTVVQATQTVKDAATAVAAALAQAVDQVTDPADGAFTTQVDQFRDSLAEITATMGGDDSPVTKGITKQFDQLVKRVSDQLHGHQKAVNSQLSIADPASPMAQVMGKLATLDKTVDSLKAEITTARAVQTTKARSTLHGLDYEDQVLKMTASIVSGTGDGFEDTRATGGRNSRCKDGDGVLTVRAPGRGAAQRVVLEAKNSLLTATAWKRELDDAMDNRDAVVALAVVRIQDQVPSGTPFTWIDDRRAVVAFNPEVDDLSWLQMTIQLMRLVAIGFAPSADDDIDTDRISTMVRTAKTELDRIAEIRKKATTASGAIDAIRREADALEGSLMASLTSIQTEIGGDA